MALAGRRYGVLRLRRGTCGSQTFGLGVANVRVPKLRAAPLTSRSGATDNDQGDYAARRVAAVRPSVKRARARSWLCPTGTSSVAFGRPIGFVET